LLGHICKLVIELIKNGIYYNSISLVCFQHQFLTEILRYRAQSTPDHNLFTLLNSKVRLTLSLSVFDLNSLVYWLIFYEELWLQLIIVRQLQT